MQCALLPASPCHRLAAPTPGRCQAAPCVTIEFLCLNIVLHHEWVQNLKQIAFSHSCAVCSTTDFFAAMICGYYAFQSTNHTRCHVFLQVQQHGRCERSAAGSAEMLRLPTRPVLLAGMPEGCLEAAQGCVPSGGGPFGEHKQLT